MKATGKDIAIIPGIEGLILSFRGHRVMVDADLAGLYGVETRALNQTVKRNIRRFPENFMFELAPEEKKELVTNCDRFLNLRHSTASPKVFTERGVLMLSNVLKSDRAIDVSIQVIEAFVRLRAAILSTPDLAKKIADIEAKLTGLQDRMDTF
ncbi:MAG: ORF6N domain-containing protein, partial [Rectinemataceae bacterium]|nr:ORF6N domain-containing protein [Rectinemataceae bacterium]